MLDITSKTDLYESIKSAKNNSQYHALATKIIEANRAALEEQKKSRVSLGPDASDEEVRAAIRQVLLDRIGDGTLSAADIAQTKDLFGLKDKEQEIIVNLIDYSNLTDEDIEKTRLAQQGGIGQPPGVDVFEESQKRLRKACRG